MKKWIIAIAGIGVFLILILVHGRIRQTDEVIPEFVLSYAENQQLDYPTTRGANYFARLVEERTQGRIKIMVFDSGKLGTETDVLVQMQYGGVDMARVSISQLSAYAPEMDVLQMPYLYRDSDHMWKVLDGEIGNQFLNEMSCDCFVGLSWYDAGARSFYTKKPITCLEDMKGMKIRVQESDLMIDAVNALGARAVTYDYAAVYSAIQTGNVAGAENNWPSYESMQHYSVAPYFVEDEHTRVPEMQIINSHTWDKIKPEDQAIIRECARASAEYERGLWQEQEKKAKEQAIAKGAIVCELNLQEKARFREAMSDVYEKYCKDYMDIIEAISRIE